MLDETDSGTAVATFESLKEQPKTFLVAQQDSSQPSTLLPDDSIDHVVTDPPYFDSVQYSDLAAFFRVWLCWFLPAQADWHYETGNSAVAESTQDGEKYQRILTGIWQQCHRVLKKPSGRLIFTFHHWRAEAWAHLTLALKDANFHLDNFFVIYSENPISVHIRQLNALKHDAVLILQPAPNPKADRQYELIQQIDTTESANFCRDCAKILGFCLESKLNNEEIFEVWQEMLGNEIEYGLMKNVGASLAVAP